MPFRRVSCFTPALHAAPILSMYLCRIGRSRALRSVTSLSDARNSRLFLIVLLRLFKENTGFEREPRRKKTTTMDLDKYGDSPHVYTPFMPVSTYITYVAAFLAVVAAIAMLIKWKLKKVPAEQVDNDSSPHTLLRSFKLHLGRNATNARLSLARHVRVQFCINAARCQIQATCKYFLSN